MAKRGSYARYLTDGTTPNAQARADTLDQSHRLFSPTGPAPSDPPQAGRRHTERGSHRRHRTPNRGSTRLWLSEHDENTSPAIHVHAPVMSRYHQSAAESPENLLGHNGDTSIQLRQQKTRLSGLFLERMMGFEPTTFCMASRRSSQLSYIRETADYSRGLSPSNRALR